MSTQEQHELSLSKEVKEIVINYKVAYELIKAQDKQFFKNIEKLIKS